MDNNQKALALMQAAAKLTMAAQPQQPNQPAAQSPLGAPPAVATPQPHPVAAPGTAMPAQPFAAPPVAGQAVPAIPQLQGLPPSAPQAASVLTLDQLASMTPDQINANWSQVQALMDAPTQ